MKSKHFTALLLSVLLFLPTLLFTGCLNKNIKEVSGTQFFFDTVINIRISGTDDESLLEECFSLCREYENKFSRTIETSEISQINHAKGQPVTVSDETIVLLQKALKYCELSDGSFDITVAPLSELWNFKENTGTLPSEDAIAEAASHVDYRNVKISGNTVTLADSEAAIDLGGIAKGYIADQLKKFLQDEGVEHALISLGGNVLTVGEKIDGSSYNIGIQKPFDKKNTAITSVSVKDQSVVSSGVYERYFKVDGKLYHHILNPQTGYPYENNLLGVTIISDSSADGDALSTTCFTLGLEKGMELIESLENTEAIFITSDESLHYSKGLQ